MISDEMTALAAKAAKLDTHTLRAVYEMAPIGVTLTREGITEYCNSAYLRMFGYEGHESEIYGKSLLAMLAPEERDVIAKRIARRASGADVETTYDSIGLRRDGSRFPFHVSVRRLELSDGPVTLAFFFDLSERRIFEERVRQTNEKLNALIQACPLPIISVDAEGRVWMWNSAAERTFGWSAEEALGTLNPIIPDAQRTEYERNVADALTRGLYGVEGRRQRRDGGLVDVNIFAAPVRGADGQPVGAVALMMDVTERRKAEQALRHSQEQLRHAQKMEAVGRLAGGVAHDFNNLLTAISGFADLLRLQLRSPEAQASESLGEIQRAVARAAGLVQQLLAFSRRQDFRLTVVDLNDVVTGMAGMLGRLIGPKVELVTDLAADLGCVRADAGQVEQVIVNLVVNAQDALTGTGRISVRTANETLEQPLVRPRFTVPAGSWVLLEVSDTGIGMDDSVLSHLFEPFFTTKERGKGTGLGLSTVYGIVTQSKGHLLVESTPGSGSTFRVYLPRVERTRDSGSHWISPSSSPGEGTIVVVEDDRILLELTRGILERAGYDVIAASSAEEGLERLEQASGRVRLLLTDVLMPSMSGPELAERVWDKAPGIPVLFVSGFADPASFPADFAGRNFDFLAKPFTAEVLLGKLCAVLGRVSEAG